MSPRKDYRDESRVRHMCRALAKIVEKSTGLTRESLVEGEDNTELIIHYLTILGEAANNVSDEFAQRYPDIDFAAMAGVRHRLVHDYANIDLDIIWEIVSQDVPRQYPRVKALAESLPEPATPPNVSEFA
jgi:uncharacterized protein with HEPN domain